MLGLLVLRQTLLPALLGFTGDRLARSSRLDSFLGGKLFGRGRAAGQAGEAGRSTKARSDKKDLPAAQPPRCPRASSWRWPLPRWP
jgi:hypothetical protein